MSRGCRKKDKVFNSEVLRFLYNLNKNQNGRKFCPPPRTGLIWTKGQQEPSKIVIQSPTSIILEWGAYQFWVKTLPCCATFIFASKYDMETLDRIQNSWTTVCVNHNTSVDQSFQFTAEVQPHLISVLYSWLQIDAFTYKCLIYLLLSVKNYLIYICKCIANESWPKILKKKT